MTPRLFSLFLAIGLVAGCATTPSPDVRRGAAINPNVGAAGSTSATTDGTTGTADPNDVPAP